MSRRRKLARHPNPRENDSGCFWWHDSSRGRKMGRFFLKGAAKCPAVQKEGEQREHERLRFI
jgi:hypothetical protein